MGSFAGSPGSDTQAQAALAVAREGFYEGAAAGGTALIVEDDRSSAFALTALLERGGMTVIAAPSGPAALDILDQGVDVDIVLMDILMPAMDGYETMTAMRQRAQTADLPIIAITGRVFGSERERCLAAGASEYVAKPINTAELLAAVSHLLASTDQLPPS